MTVLSFFQMPFRRLITQLFFTVTGRFSAFIAGWRKACWIVLDFIMWRFQMWMRQNGDTHIGGLFQIYKAVTLFIQ